MKKLIVISLALVSSACNQTTTTTQKVDCTSVIALIESKVDLLTPNSTRKDVESTVGTPDAVDSSEDAYIYKASGCKTYTVYFYKDAVTVIKAE